MATVVFCTYEEAALQPHPTIHYLWAVVGPKQAKLNFCHFSGKLAGHDRPRRIDNSRGMILRSILAGTDCRKGGKHWKRTPCWAGWRGAGEKSNVIDPFLPTDDTGLDNKRAYTWIV